MRKLRLRESKKKLTVVVCIVLSRTFHTYRSDEAHEEEEPNAEEDIRVHAALDLAAFVPRAAVVQHGFRLVAFEQK